MKLKSSNSPIYLPEKEQKSVLRLGFKNCPQKDWIYPAVDLTTFYQHKLNTHSLLKEKCSSSLPQSGAAQKEFYALLLQHLIKNKKLGYHIEGEYLIHGEHNLRWELNETQLWQASLWVAEDFCLLEKVDNKYVMTAASICSPSNWNLEEKIGESIEKIHEDVPNYGKMLNSRVNRFHQGLTVRKPMLRFNWSVQRGNELLWRDESMQDPVHVNATSDNLYWRIERQTFLRLPLTGAIVFGVRIFLHSFKSMGNDNKFEDSISELITQLPLSEKQYKGLG